MSTTTWDLAGIRLAVAGDRGRVAHLAREYDGAARQAGAAPPDVSATFRRTDGRKDRHKGTSWRVRGSALDAETLALDIEAHGPFADAMVQSLVIEPALGLRASAHGSVLVSGAALRAPEEDLTVLVIGSSRAGKSVLALAARMARWEVIADDRVSIDADGIVRGLPRRMRLYPSSIDIVQGASQRLTTGERGRVTMLRMLDRLTAGAIRMPLLVPPIRFGGRDARGPETPRRIDAVVLLSRDPGVATMAVDAIDPAQAVAAATDVIAADRTRLVAQAGDGWGATLGDVRAAEAATLARAFDRVPSYRVVVPIDQPPEDTLAALRRLGSPDHG